MNHLKELLSYLFFGVLTTLVNIIAYWLFTEPLGVHYLVSNAIAWVLSVLFAYVTNRRYVFHSTVSSPKALLAEMLSFFGCRLFSGLVDMGCMYLLVDVVKWYDFTLWGFSFAMYQWREMTAKIITNVLVVVLNYLFSKLLIFKNKGEQ